MARKPAKPKTATTDMGKPGPEPERLKITGDWEAAAERIVKAKKPARGWPAPKKRKRKA